MFENEAFIDFTIAENRAEFSSALDGIAAEVSSNKLVANPIISGKAVTTDRVEKSLDPSNSKIALGDVYYAGPKEVADALEDLQAGAREWSRRPAQERSSIINKIGVLMQERRMRLAALVVREAGKPWAEADADIVEAIDFCSYYAREMERLATPRKTQEVMGEENTYFYQARGIGVVIAPWNFPMAIPCGMLVASLVTGNATILKPAEQTSLIAAELANLVLEAGVPENAFALLPGQGEEIGPLLVNSPKVNLICFTGSKAVGLEIIKNAAEIQPGQTCIKKVIAELGGKNAVIVDEDADLDEAIKGIGYSAFGFSGQKCSACSRVIAVGDAYETFLERFAEATGDLLVGDASDPGTFVGPVIDEESQQRILNTIAEAERECTLAFKGNAPDGGYYVPPVVFRDVTPDKKLWREEIFGPVLACQKVDSFEEALQRANDSQYALTGGIFSRSPAHIKQATQEFAVGNLYINRGCTGAIVCRQPFGGFRMSGIGSKAGGPDYLLQFLEPRTVTENTMRRGFTPEFA